MKLERIVRRRVEALPGTIVLSALLLGGAVSAAWFRLGLPAPACRFRQWTGLPCATCGTTRLVQALGSGDVVQALSLNPLVFCGLALTVAWGSLSAVRLASGSPRRHLVLEPRDRARLLLVAAAAVIADWIYLLVRGI